MMETCNFAKSDECSDISARTWNRSADTLAKLGYMDGASDGQTAAFQTSFDTGYDQGINFGLQIGFYDALNSLKEAKKDSGIETLVDSRKINCLICLNINTEENIDNLFNAQEKKNLEFLKRFCTDK